MAMRVNSIGTVRNNFEYKIDVAVRLNTNTGRLDDIRFNIETRPKTSESTSYLFPVSLRISAAR